MHRHWNSWAWWISGSREVRITYENLWKNEISKSVVSSWLRHIIKGRRIIVRFMIRKIAKRIVKIPMTGGGISVSIGIKGILLLRRDRNTFSIIGFEIGPDIWLTNSTTAVVTLVTIRCLTSTEEDVATCTAHKATNPKLLQGFERIETKPAFVTLRDWLMHRDWFPPPNKTPRTTKLMEFTACSQIMYFQYSLRQRRIALRLIVDVLSPVFNLYVYNRYTDFHPVILNMVLLNYGEVTV